MISLSRPRSQNWVELTNDQFDEVEIREVSYFGVVPMDSGTPAALHRIPACDERTWWRFVPSVIADHP